MSRLRVVLQGTAVAAALACALVVARTVADWRADALRWRAAGSAAPMDSLALATVRRVQRERDTARVRELRAGARLDSALAAWARRDRRQGETRGPDGPRGSDSAATVAPPVDTGACDELAAACAHFRLVAAERAVADSTAAAVRRQADSAAAHARIAQAQRAAADSITAARDTVQRVRGQLRRARWETWLAIGAVAALLVHR